MGVLVDLIRGARKHLQISGHMNQYKSDQEKAREGDNPFSPDGGSDHEKNVVLHGSKNQLGLTFKMRPPMPSVKITSCL
jgi:hypothetical protein